MDICGLYLRPFMLKLKNAIIGVNTNFHEIPVNYHK